jgi:hemerythrin-like domain-containing protein
MPIGPLMVEHRLIERLLSDVQLRLEQFQAERQADTAYLRSVIEFIRTYADRCHHGKEEDILFKALLAKDPEPTLAEETHRLIAEHAWARETVGRLARAAAGYDAGEPSAFAEIATDLRGLLDFYPVHIAKEDKHYFKPAMAYFSAEEQAVMLQRFREFDGALLHDHYLRFVEDLEERGGRPPRGD